MNVRPEALTTRFLKARMLRDWPQVWALGDEFLKRAPHTRQVHLALARLHEELEDQAKALRHWRILSAQDPKDFEAAYAVARSMIAAGSSLDAVAASASDGMAPAFKENLLAVLRDPPTAPQQHGVRNIVICGVSYCGSTLIDRLLGALPGVASIGESHWLVKGKIPGAGYDLLDFSRDFAVDMVKCSACGKNCPVLTKEFRRALAADRTGWYFRIAERLGTRTLIAGDKNPPKILDNDPLLRFDALVLFKSLPQAWWSELQKRKPGQDEAYYLSECERYVTTWSQSYATFLESFAPQGKVVFLSFEEFAKAPAEVLPAVCKALSLPFDVSVFEFARQGHAIGGNSGALRRLRDTDYTPNIAPLPPPPLAQSHLDILARSAEAKRIFGLLQGRHDATMRDAKTDSTDRFLR